jgi:SAM-dependent methyltransferase
VSADLVSFIREHLSPPARVLEVGCGAGDLTRELAAAGYDVVAVDPEAPEGPLFRRVRLEDFDDPGAFDAVVAARSLHHVDDLATALERIAALLNPAGVLILDEFAHDRLDAATADWYYGQRCALAAAGGGLAPASFEACRAEWEDDHAGLHGYTVMRRDLDARFLERDFSWEPYLYRELGGPATEALERTLIEAGAIQAAGFRYVGTIARDG